MIKELYEIVRDYFSGEIKKIQNLDTDKRGTYILEYHKWKFIIFFTVIVLIAVGITQALTSKSTVFNLAIVNQEVNLEEDKEKDSMLAEVLGIDEKKSKVNVDSSYQILWKEEDIAKNEYTDYDKFFLNVSNGNIDCAIVPEGFADYCFSLEEFALPLSELGAESVVKEKQYVYNGIACGIYTDDTEFAGVDKRERYVAFFPYTGRNKNVSIEFAAYISELIGESDDAS